MKILESILDNVDSNFRNSSEKLSTNTTNEFVHYDTEFSADDYNIKISIHLVFTYNLDEIDEDNLKNNLAENSLNCAKLRIISTIVQNFNSANVRCARMLLL